MEPKPKLSAEQQAKVKQMVDRAYAIYAGGNLEALEPLFNEMDQADEVTPDMFNEIESQLATRVIEQDPILKPLRTHLWIRAGRNGKN